MKKFIGIILVLAALGLVSVGPSGSKVDASAAAPSTLCLPRDWSDYCDSSCQCDWPDGCVTATGNSYMVHGYLHYEYYDPISDVLYIRRPSY